MSRPFLPPGSRFYGSALLGPSAQSPREIRIRVQVLLTVLLLSAHVIGAITVAALFLLVRPDEPLRPAFWTAHFVALPVYVALAALIGTVVITRRLLRALAWVQEERDPTLVEQRATLRAPRMATAHQGVLWLIGALVFTGLALILQPSAALTEAIAALVAGTLVCAISYLWTEFVLRPITARALAQGPPPTRRGSGVRRRLIVFWVLGTGMPVMTMMLTAVIALSDWGSAGGEAVGRTRLAVLVLVLGGVVLLFGLYITGLTARSVVGPIASVRTALESVEDGDLEVQVPVYDATELGHLQAGFNEMAAGLRERERIRDLFGRHVGEEVAAVALRREVVLGGETREVSVLFVDLKGSTSLATRLPPEEVVDLLNRFCAVVVDEVDRAHGLVNKFMGDAILAIFGAPVAHEDHAGDALRAARRTAARLAAEVPEIDFGIGVATGEAVAGNVGDERRFEYTVIGDAVNSAARLMELSKTQAGRVVAASVTLDHADAEEATQWCTGGAEILRGRQSETAYVVLAQPQANATRSR